MSGSKLLRLTEGRMNFMPPAQNPNQQRLCEAIINDSKYVSDPSGKSNKEKWSFVLHTFNANDECALFDTLHYEDVYAEDDHVKAEAACYMADLRAQYFSKLLDEKFTPEQHLLYLNNRQWAVRFRERFLLTHMTHAMKGAILN